MYSPIYKKTKGIEIFPQEKEEKKRDGRRNKSPFAMFAVFAEKAGGSRRGKKELDFVFDDNGL